MLKKNSTLRVLELKNNLIDYSRFSGLAGSLLENKTLQSLHLNGNYCGAAAFAKDLESNKSLREIYLQGNSVGDEGVRTLISGLSLRKGKLVVLDLASNSVTARGAFHVAEYVKKSKSLLWLNLYMNDIKDELDRVAAGVFRIFKAENSVDSSSRFTLNRVFSGQSCNNMKCG